MHVPTLRGWVVKQIVTRRDLSCKCQARQNMDVQLDSLYVGPVGLSGVTVPEQIIFLRVIDQTFQMVPPFSSLTHEGYVYESR